MGRTLTKKRIMRTEKPAGAVMIMRTGKPAGVDMIMRMGKPAAAGMTTETMRKPKRMFRALLRRLRCLWRECCCLSRRLLEPCFCSPAIWFQDIRC